MLTYYLFCAVARDPHKYHVLATELAQAFALSSGRNPMRVQRPVLATELGQAFALSLDFVPIPGATSRLANLK